MPKAKPREMIIELPTQPQVGDRIRLRHEKVAEYEAACKLAGYDFDPHAVYVVQRDDNFCPGGGRRLFIGVPPHALGSRDVQLAWNSDRERRAMLKARGWRV